MRFVINIVSLLFQGWEEAKKHQNARQFCWNYFLSENTLRVRSYYLFVINLYSNIVFVTYHQASSLAHTPSVNNFSKDG